MIKYSILFVFILCALPSQVLAVYPSFSGFVSLFSRNKGNQPPKEPGCKLTPQDAAPRAILNRLQELLRQIQVPGITMAAATRILHEIEALYQQYVASPQVQRYPSAGGLVQAHNFMDQARAFFATLPGYVGRPLTPAREQNPHSPQGAILTAQAGTIERAVHDGLRQIFGNIGMTSAATTVPYNNGRALFVEPSVVNNGAPLCVPDSDDEENLDDKVASQGNKRKSARKSKSQSKKR